MFTFPVGLLGRESVGDLSIGLIAWWNLDEASGSRFDGHTSNLTLTAVGNINSIAGKLVNAADISPGAINGLSNAANFLQRDGAFITTGTQYWAGWIYVTAGTNNAVFQILGKYGPFEYEGGPGNRQIAIFYDKQQGQPLSVQVSSNGASGTEKSARTTCSTNTWVFFEAYYNSTTTEIGIATNNQAFAVNNTGYSSLHNATTANFKIGYYFFNSVSGTNSNRFAIDSLATWNRILTTAERNSLWNSGAGISNQKDPFYNNVSLLLLANGANNSTTFIDSGPANRTVSAVNNGLNPVITTAQSRFGGSSLTGGQVSVPYNSAFDFGTGDFTIELWFRYEGTLNGSWRFCQGTSTPYFAFGLTDFPERRIVLVLEGVVFDVTVPWPNYPAANTWAHIAVSRASGTVRFFQDGSLIGSGSSNRNWNINSSNFVVCPRSPSSTIATGAVYFDDFRVTKGVARYTAAFSPPTEQLPSS